MTAIAAVRSRRRGAAAGGAPLSAGGVRRRIAAGPPVRPDPMPTTMTGRSARPAEICTVAGTGIAGDGADGLPALETRLYLPQDTTFGPDGRLYVVDWNNHRIRVINADGPHAHRRRHRRAGPSVDDPASDRLNHPTNVTFDPMGPPDEMWIAAWHNSRVKKVDARHRRADRRLRHGQARLRRQRRPGRRARPWTCPSRSCSTPPATC